LADHPASGLSIYVDIGTAEVSSSRAELEAEIDRVLAGFEVRDGRTPRRRNLRHVPARPDQRLQFRHRVPRAPTATPLDAMNQVFEVDVFGVHRVTHAFVDLVLASRGRFVTISSLSRTRSSSLMGAYSMSKHAVEAYSGALAAHMEPQGVHAALFDEAPLARHPVVPVADEAHRTLAQASGEWARLNASTPYAWTVERLLEEVEGAGEG
jgi:NAD(P)-dependent dehydrogenase (short-subunit alcohol dehydrogenase family)